MRKIIFVMSVHDLYGDLYEEKGLDHILASESNELLGKLVEKLPQEENEPLVVYFHPRYIVHKNKIDNIGEQLRIVQLIKYSKLLGADMPIVVVDGPYGSKGCGKIFMEVLALDDVTLVNKEDYLETVLSLASKETELEVSIKRR